MTSSCSELETLIICADGWIQFPQTALTIGPSWGASCPQIFSAQKAPWSGQLDVTWHNVANDFLNPTPYISTTCSFSCGISFTHFHEAHSIIKERPWISLFPFITWEYSKEDGHLWGQSLPRHGNLTGPWSGTSWLPELREMFIFVVTNHPDNDSFAISSPNWLTHWCFKP